MTTSGELPTGVVTFVLTDIAGSTELWEQCPDDMANALGVHDAVITEAVAQHDGVVVKSRGEGDSTFSVFQRASDAVRAAYEAQVAWTALDWPQGATLRVRVAVHTGEATERDGDYVGTTVNRAARLRGIAEPGEVVVSASVAHLVADHLPLDTLTRSLGPVRLRGLEREEEAFALVGPGLGHPAEGARGETRIDLLAERGVTRRERDVFEAVAGRLTNAEIATRFSVSERTVETHVSSLLRKLGVSNRLELAALATEVGTSPKLDLPPMLVMSAQRSQCLGRADERQVLLNCWDRAAAGQVGLAVITGEAGIGKSRLAADLAIEVNRRGGQVLLGASTDGAPAPYQPFSEALVDTIALTPERQLRADAGRHLEPLARALPSVGARLGIPTPVVGVDPSSDRYASQVGIAAFLAATAQRQPTLLVLEDLHWASGVTRQAVLHLARTGGAAPLLVVATTRDAAPELDDELRRWLADAVRLPICDLVPLSGLDLDATEALLAELGGDLDPSVALHDTGGNPLFLRELATAGTSSTTLRDLVAERYGRLSDEDLDVVDAGAVLGESVRADLVAAAVSRPVEDVLDSLQRACDGGLMEPVSGRPGEFAFAHALYRSTRYDSLSAGRRLRLHASVAAALLPRQDDPSVLPDLARHACVAAPLAGAEAAMALARRAGLASLDASDHAEAARHFQRALDVAGLVAQPDDRLVLGLTIRLGGALVPFDLGRGHEVLRDAVRLARRLDDGEAFADAVCSMTVEYGSYSVGRLDPNFIALAEEALERLPDDAAGWRSRLLGTLGTHLALGGSAQRGQAMVREALAIARQINDPLRIVEAALCSHFTLDVFEIEERLDAMGEAVELCRKHDWGRLASSATVNFASAHRASGDFDAMHRAETLLRESVDVFPLSVLSFESVGALLMGDLDRAERVISRSDDITANFGAQPLYSGSIRLHAALLRGKAPWSWLEPFAEGPSFAAEGARALLAFSYLQGGRRADAEGMLDEVSSTGFERVPVGLSHAESLAIWSEVAAAVEDTDSMTRLLAAFDPIAGRLADGAGMVWSSVDQVRAQLTLGLGDATGAESIASRAIAASRRRGTRLFLGRELVVLAAARRQLGAEPAAVAEPVDEALAIADDTGAQLIRHEAVRMGVAS